MIPRGTLDIDLSDWLYAIAVSLCPQNEQNTQQAVQEAWAQIDHNNIVERLSSTQASLACLSVRSGFDLVLQALALPPGSEVLVSALTIPDMVRILQHHQLVAVPVDLNVHTMGVEIAHLEAALTPKTRAVLIAHLFGSRMPIDGIVDFAARHQLLLFEDCAQAYDGHYRGHPASDVSLFSFGIIKTHTALGGAILRLRDPQLLSKITAIQAQYPLQSRWAYLQRVLKLGSLMLLSPPPVYSVVIRLLRQLGIEHDSFFSKLTRGFPGADFIEKIRRQPCAPLLQLLARRLQQQDCRSIQRRVALAQSILQEIPTVAWPGEQAESHVHWVLPILSPCPDGLVEQLWEAGFDATRRASSLAVVEPPADRPCCTVEAKRLVEQLLYLPLYRKMQPAEVKRLGQVIANLKFG